MPLEERSCFAQTDTTLLERFYVRELAGNGLQPYHHDEFDTLLLKGAKSGSLADLLVQTSPLTIKYYGPGQLASANFRGTSASQTMIVWNGIRINNPMMMQSDLGSFPAAIIGSGSVVYGPGTLGFAAGAFGAVIKIQPLPAGTVENSIDISTYLGSFGYSALYANLELKHKRLRNRTLFYRDMSENDFTYPDNFSSSRPYNIVRREGSSWLRHGLMQSLSLLNEKGISGDLVIWVNQKHTNLPYPIHQQQARYTQSQADDDLRILLQGRKRYGNILVEAHSAFQAGSMHYLESRSKTDAMHHTQNYQQAITFRGLTKGLVWRASVNYEMQKVITSEYQEDKTRHILATFGELRNPAGSKYLYGIVARGEFVPGYGLDLMPSALLGYRAGKDRKHLIKATATRNRQLPGFNDLYWVPGGNSDLMPETMLAAELSYERSRIEAGALVLSPKLLVFRQRVENKIMWLPDTGIFWNADNIGLVKMSGIEASLEIYAVIRKSKIKSVMRYNYVSAGRWSEDQEPVVRQLIYQPYHTAAFNAQISNRAGMFIWETTATGLRYTNAENTAYMPGHTLSNIKYISPGIKSEYALTDIFISIYNLFDAKYQAIAWYPMPGRHFRIGVNLKFKP